MPSQPSIQKQTAEVLAWLKSQGSQHNIDGMARYAIKSEKVFGVSVSALQQYSKQIGRSHALALELWKTGWYEARMLTGFVDEPERVTPAQMDRWSRDFDNWAICDHLCFHLFDRTPHAWAKVEQWSQSDKEFVKRAGFALLASLAGHDKRAGDQPFLDRLPLIEQGAGDGRNFVKKAVSWALRRIGGRSAALHTASIALAQRLAKSSNAAERWVGKDTLRDITRPLVAARFTKGEKRR